LFPVNYRGNMKPLQHRKKYQYIKSFPQPEYYPMVYSEYGNSKYTFI